MTVATSPTIIIIIVAQILGVKGSVLETRFGTASVLRYPASACLSELGEDKGTALRNEQRTVEVGV